MRQDDLFFLCNSMKKRTYVPRYYMENEGLSRDNRIKTFTCHFFSNKITGNDS